MTRLLQVRQMAESLMSDHGLDVDAGSWFFEFDGAKRRCGQCRHGDRVISLSRHYVTRNDDADIRNTILHEIAHALVGPGHGHDLTWKAKARYVGAKPVRCNSTADLPKGKWLATCGDCGTEYRRHRLSQGMRESWCRCTDWYLAHGNKPPLLEWHEAA